MRLTLDWDSEEIKDIHLPAVMSGTPAGTTEKQERISNYVEGADPDALADSSDKLELWQSSGGEGYHYIEYDRNLSLERSRQVRTSYGDDQMRISMDGDRIANGSPFVGVLYHMKGIKPGEQKPYETGQRAELLVREGFDGSDTADTKDTETGRIDYGALTEALAEHSDFTSRAALFRKVQSRPSVDVSTDPSKRGYDIVNGRRKPTVNEAKALRDYAQSRDIGHYGTDDAGTPAELAAKPSRTTFHEYFTMPEFDLDANDFGEGDPSEWDSEKYPVNIRTGTYSDQIDEMTLKQVHDRIAEQIANDTLLPGFEQQRDGATVWKGPDPNNWGRWNRMISLERDRPIDADEVARYRRVAVDNQPSGGSDIMDVLPDADPFAPDSDALCWEVIVYTEDYGGVWWVARGILDVAEHGVKQPIGHSTIVADTEGFL